MAAAQEERFTRKKHDSSFPVNAIDFCLKSRDVRLEDVDYVAFYDKPFLKFERLIETYLAFAPRGFKSFRMAIPLWVKEKLFQKDLLRKEMRKFYPEFDWEKRAAVCRASSESCGKCVLSFAVRRGSNSDDGRGGRMVYDVGRQRGRK